MIKLYAPLDARDGADLDQIQRRARAALGRGRHEEAIGLLFAGLGQSNLRDDDARRVAELLRGAYAAAARPREVLSIDWYLGARERQEADLDKATPIDRGRTLLSWAASGRRPGDGRASDDLLAPAPVADPTEARKRAHEAACVLESAGLLVRAAIAFERADDWERARTLWSRLSPALTATSSLYEAALAQFNLFRASQKVGDARAARSAGIAAVHLLEEAADRYETSGQRERAFDCYRVLIAIGKETGTFEHSLEGFVNVLRILQEDHLRLYALQTFEEAVQAARAEGELVAAATLSREMGVFARKEGEAAIANHAAVSEAELWRQVARASRARGGPVAVAEHALLSAVLALGEIGQYKTVGGVYEELAALDLEAKKKAHYVSAGRRYTAARDERLDAHLVPTHLQQDSGFPDVWHVDLLEWEEAGSASEACANILLDPGAYADVTRRRALLARLVALAAEGDQQSPEGLALLCQRLADLALYGILPPLERLSAHPHPRVREAAVLALAHFKYKRTFQTIRRALQDPDPQVVARAAQAIVQLRFAHAIDVLTRLYRESPVQAARHASLRALAEIDRVEAAEMLLGVLSYGSPEDRAVAVEALSRSKRKSFEKAARAAMADLDVPTRKAVRDILKARGLPV